VRIKIILYLWIDRYSAWGLRKLMWIIPEQVKQSNIKVTMPVVKAELSFLEMQFEGLGRVAVEFVLAKLQNDSMLLIGFLPLVNSLFPWLAMKRLRHRFYLH
jgi:hypothetical protein